MAFWNKFPYSNFHEINLDWIIREMKKISGSVSDFARQWEKALKQETGERQEADRQLQENIDAEQDRAEAAEEALDQKIEAETSRAEAAEKVLDDKITAETDRATEAEEALDQKIEAETDRATEKENNLQEQITAEVNRATAAEGTLDQKITAETNRATGVENELRGLITTETERATAAEGALGDRIDGLEGELEGVTGADSPFIRKDGTTTTTGKIPLAQGGTSEVDPAAATDLVNLRSMQAADQALESSMTEYVDNQLEAAVADVHSIPAGGTAGQVLGKVDGTDYNVHWVDQTGGGSAEGAVLLNSRANIQKIQSINPDGWVLEKTGGASLGPTRMYLGNGKAGISMADGVTGDGPDISLQWTDSSNNRVDIGAGGSHVGIEVESDSATVTIEGDDIQLQHHSVTPTAGDVWTATDAEGHGTWSAPASGSDPDAIKKDGTTTTTARIPFAEGVGIDSDNYWTERDFVSLTFGDTGSYTQIQNSNGNVAALYATNPDGSAILNGVRVEPDGLQIKANGENGTAGQVLTAKGDGTCGWADAAGGGGSGSYEERVVANVKYVKQGRRVDVVWNSDDKEVTFDSFLQSGSVYKDYSNHFYNLSLVPEGFRPASTASTAIPLHDTGSNGDIWGYVYIQVKPDGSSVTNAKAFKGDSVTSRVYAFTRGQIMIGWYTE